MSNHEFKSVKEMIDALTVARDRARVQAHLLSLDAKERWKELETTLVGLQSKLENEGERIVASAADKARGVTKAVKDLLHELDDMFELASPVRKIMREAPITCAPEDSLTRAAQIMWEADCGAVPVVDAEGTLTGVITDRDICMASYTRGESLASMTVSSAMSTDVHSCSPEASIGHAARLMAAEQVRRLPVTDGGRLVGVLSLADLARDIAKHSGDRLSACVALAHTLAAISEPRSASESARAAAE